MKNLLVIIFMLLPFSVGASQPKWVGNTPRELNDTYKFIEIISYGGDMSSARMNALHTLAQDQRLADAALVSVQSGMLTHADTDIDSKGSDSERIHEEVDLKVEVKGQDYKVQAKKIDEYVGHEAGQVKLHTLYMVALTDNPEFDRTYLTDSYGPKPAFMSIIPGLGQWYKGSKVKGTCMFAGAVLSVAGIIVCENQRASYHKKMIEQPKFAKEYNSKASNWETGRNICIGVAGAVWIYSIVDAAVARGARRVVVDKAKGSVLSFSPVFTPDAAGLALSLNF
jgi:hypothetical protein